MVPVELLPSRSAPGSARRLLEACARANMNTVRVWCVRLYTLFECGVCFTSAIVQVLQEGWKPHSRRACFMSCVRM